MNRMNIKPLSVNKCWQGKRFKTKEYQTYERELLYSLPKIKVSNQKELSIDIIVGVSYNGSDIDNFLKPMIDIMQKRYGFNDKNIVWLSISKKTVKKGNEYIEFKIEEL